MSTNCRDKKRAVQAAQQDEADVATHKHSLSVEIEKVSTSCSVK